MKRLLAAAGFAALLAFMSLDSAAAADKWTEMKSAHFTVWSNASDGATRDLLWQFEQIRGAVATMWPWAKVDLTKPIQLLAARDEQAMKGLAPEYWEQKGAVHPASVWVEGADQNYIVIRTDVRSEDTDTINPYTNAYFSYVSLILGSSFDRPVPLWFLRGLAGVGSNTIVRRNQILFGPPIPWHIQLLRERSGLRLKDLIHVTRSSPDYKVGDRLERFDAQSWAFMHYLIFGDHGAHQPAVNKFSGLLAAGKDPDIAFAEAIGRVEDIEAGFASYVQRDLFGYQKLTVDARTNREQFVSRALPPADAAAGRAAFHVAMGRSAEARTLIDEARKIDANIAGAYVAEGLMLDREQKRAEAKAAYEKAVELGTTSAYAHHRAAVLNWAERAEPDQATLARMEKDLARAVELNPYAAASYAALAEVRAALRKPQGEIFPLIEKAITIDPSDPWHRLSAARVLWRLGNLDQARKIGQAALSIAVDDDAARNEAQKLLASMPDKDKGTTTGATPTAPSASASAPATDPNSFIPACQQGDADACRNLAPFAEKACASGDKRACHTMAILQWRGSGVPKDERRAFATFEQLCNGGTLESCTQLAVLIASDSEKRDLGRARDLLSRSCTGGISQACDLLKQFPK